MGSRDQGYDLNKFQNGRNGGHFGGARTPLSLLLGNVLQPICGPIVFIRNLSIFSFSLGFSKTYMRFTAYMRAYCFYTKATNFLVFCGFFKKRKASGVSLGSRGQGYEFNMFENGRKDGHIGGARRLIPLLLC